MSQASITNTINIENAFINPTSDVWQEDFQNPEYEQITTNINRIPRDSFASRLNSLSAFEETELLELYNETNLQEFETMPATFILKEEFADSFSFFVLTNYAQSNFQTEDQITSQFLQTGFSPDFYNIKRYVTFIMKQTNLSLFEQELSFEEPQNFTVIIQPEVVKEAEEKALSEDLEASIKIAQECYPTLKGISLNLEYDPEIIDRKTIRLTLNVSGDPEIILKNEELFNVRLRSTIKHHTREQITITYEW